MNILIFEYITGGGLADQPLPASLVREGDMILSAAVNDFKVLPGCNVFVLRDHRLNSSVPGAHTVIVEPDDSYGNKLEAFADKVHSMLIIAPENDDILCSLCKRYSELSFELLNSELQTIKLTSHKFATYRYLLAHKIPQIPTCLATDIGSLEGEQFVMKPEDGVGCANTSLLVGRLELQAAASCSENGRNIFQPYIKGIHASLSLLCWEGACHVLSCNEQRVQEAGEFLRWTGCIVGAFENRQFTNFASQIVQALPGLRGYIGVDVIITENEILLVEVNPRLTTSYVGLGAALGINPAQLIVQCFTDQKLPETVPACQFPIEVNLEEGYAC